MKLYLTLFHGRTAPDQEMDDWGSQGPVFGPLSSCHTTYGTDVRLSYLDATGDTCDLHITKDGLLYYDGIYYGDWSTFISDKEEITSDYDPAKATLPREPEEPLRSVPEDEVNDEECETCDGYGFFLSAAHEHHPRRILACADCEHFYSDAKAVEAAFKLALAAHDHGLQPA